MKKLNKKGFTLVELLAVIVILAILMVVAFSVIPNVQNNARASAIESEATKMEGQVIEDYQLFLTGTTEDGKKYTYADVEITNITTATDFTFKEGEYTMYATFDGSTVTDYCIEDKNGAMLKNATETLKGYQTGEKCKDSKNFNR